jgi:hypothetical protein
MKCRLLLLLISITHICFIFTIVELNNISKLSKYRQADDKRVSSNFQDIINEIRTLKIGLFGDPDENMDFYKRNKNAYDPKIIEKMTKIGKILELEELLEFYNNNKKRKFLTSDEDEDEAENK